MKKKLVLTTLFTLFFALGIYFSAHYLIGKSNFKYVKSLISYENKQAIKKYIFPYKFITQQQTLINQQQTLINQYKDELILNKEYLAVIKNYEKDIRFEQTQKNIYIDKIREFDKLPFSQFEMDFQKNYHLL